LVRFFIRVIFYGVSMSTYVDNLGTSYYVLPTPWLGKYGIVHRSI